MARLFADHIGRHIPGNPTVILVQMPGAGGVQAVEYVANVAPKDGTVIGEILSPALLVPMMRKVRFDPTKLQWLGSLTRRPGVVAVWHTARATTLEGAKKVEINMGSSGVGAGNFQIPTLANAVLGTKFKVVTGYKSGGDINLAIERGEVDGRFNYWSGWTSVKPEWIRDRKLKFLFRTGPRAPDMPELPAFADLASGEERQMVRILEAPDDVGVGFYLAAAFRPIALRRCARHSPICAGQQIPGRGATSGRADRSGAGGGAARLSNRSMRRRHVIERFKKVSWSEK